MLKHKIVLENTKSEIIGIYDENNNFLGEADRKEVRIKNLIHRATSVTVLNNEKKILLQKRAKFKEYCPSYFEVGVGGCVGVNEDPLLSAKREVKEEIGLDVDDLENKMKYYETVFYQDESSRTFNYCYILSLSKNEEKKINFSDGEVEKIDWLNQEEIMQKIKHDKEFKITPESIVTLEKVINKGLV